MLILDGTALTIGGSHCLVRLFSTVSYFEWNIIHISKFKPGTVEKNSSTIGPPARIEPTPFAMPVQCSCH